MRVQIFFIFSLMLFLNQTQAQEEIQIWPQGKMPNSKGLKLEEIDKNERITQVGTPGMVVFTTSKEENKGSAVLIFPPGGYQKLTYNIAGYQFAKWLNTMGITAFVLKHRLPNSPDLIDREKGPLQDAQRALRLIRANAAKWKIRPDKIGVMGASAGGHLTASIATFHEDVSAIGDSLDTISFRPDFAIMISPVISMGQYTHTGSRDNLLGPTPPDSLLTYYSCEFRVNSKTPPCFLVHAANDNVVNPRNSILFYQALLDNHIPATLHIFPEGAHSIALRNNPGSTNLWPELCEMWLKEINVID